MATSAARACLLGLMLGLTGGRLPRPPVGGAASRGFSHLARLSAAFALVSDAALGTLGGRLKRKEKISGRLADALAWLYLASAALRRFQHDGQPARDAAFAQFAVAHALHQIEDALDGMLANLPNRPAAWLLRPLVFPLGRRHRPPSDRLGALVARGLLEDQTARLSLTGGIYLPPSDEPGLGRLEAALDQAVAALKVETTIRDAVRSGRLDRAPGDLLLDAARAAGVISDDDRAQVLAADVVRDEVIQVDAFPAEEYRALKR